MTVIEADLRWFYVPYAIVELGHDIHPQKKKIISNRRWQQSQELLTLVLLLSVNTFGTKRKKVGSKNNLSKMQMVTI